MNDKTTINGTALWVAGRCRAAESELAAARFSLPSMGLSEDAENALRVAIDIAITHIRNAEGRAEDAVTE